MSQHQIGTADASVAATFHAPDREVAGAPLLVALHGGTYTSTYFSVPGGPFGSFLDLAARNGFPVLTIDRPGYGGSALLPEEDNTFAHQAALLDEAITRYLADVPAAAVVLVGHSIGGMIALEIAARRPQWPLVGVATSGMGARIPAGGAAEQLGSLPFSGVVDLPVPDREGVMFGPAGSYTEQAREAARSSYAPTPFIELVNAPKWARRRLAAVAGDVQVPVHNVLAEHDALWDSSAEARSEFASLFRVEVSSHLARGVGHSLDHHTAGAALHLQQLAFAFTCTVAAEADALVP